MNVQKWEIISSKPYMFYEIRTCCNFIILLSYEITLVCANLLGDTVKKGNKMQTKVTRINGFIAPLLPIPL